MTVNGKIVLVTGASGGIGGETVAVLLERGASVVAADVRAAANLDGLAGQFAERLLRTTLDVTDRAHWDRTVDAALDRFGALSGLVNCAGVRGPSTLEDMTDDEWSRAIDINQRATAVGMQACLEALTSAPGASIVNVSSVAGLMGMSYGFAYGASKWAVRGMSHAAAVQLAPKGIRVNCVLPGPIGGGMGGALTPEIERAAQAAIPAGRVGTYREVAAAIAFLLSDDASYISGADLAVDGALTSAIRL